MPLEISTSLDKNCIFFAGERVTCSLTLQNKPKQIKEEAIQLSIGHATLKAEMELNPKFFKQELFESLRVKSEHSDQTKSFMKVPIIKETRVELFSNLSIQPNSSFKTTVSFPLPRTLLSSMIGRSLKVRYCLCIGIHKQDSQPVMLELNFRVFSLNELADELLFDPFRMISIDPEFIQITNESTNPAFSFELVKEKIKAVNLSLQQVKELLRKIPKSARQPLFKRNVNDLPIEYFPATRQKFLYDVNYSGSNYAKVFLIKKSFFINESIEGIVKFSSSVQRPLFMLVYLDSYEMVDSKFAALSTTPHGIINLTRIVHCNEQYFCSSREKINFIIQLPHYLTPSFDGKIGSFKYQLRVEFNYLSGLAESSKDVYSSTVSSSGTVWNAKKGFALDSFDCLIPIDILPLRNANTSLYRENVSIEYPEEE